VLEDPGNLENLLVDLEVKKGQNLLGEATYNLLV
jgi:hypothetical protein